MTNFAKWYELVSKPESISSIEIVNEIKSGVDSIDDQKKLLEFFEFAGKNFNISIKNKLYYPGLEDELFYLFEKIIQSRISLSAKFYMTFEIYSLIDRFAATEEFANQPTYLDLKLRDYIG